MRVALILSGSIRNLEDTYLSLKYHILDKFENIDIFFYGCENSFGKSENEKQIINFLSPKKFIINYNNYYNHDNGNNLLNNNNIDQNSAKNNHEKSIWAFYNVMMCNELKKEYEIEKNIKYDLIIRSRLDGFWFRGLTNLEISQISNNILIPWDWAFRSTHPSGGTHPFGYADVYCISNNILFNYYANVYNFINEFSNKYLYTPESLLGYYLKNHSVIECKRHMIFEYPLKQNIVNNEYSDYYYHPILFDNEKDRKRYD